MAVMSASAAFAAEFTSTGQALTPKAASGAIFQPLNPGLPGNPGFIAGQASAVALSPDGRTLLILTSGFNRNYGPTGPLIPEQSNEYVFVYDVSGPTPVKRQVLTPPNTFLGIAWAPAGDRFFVSGGVNDDVMEFVSAGGAFSAGRTFPLGHNAGLGLVVKPEAAGLAVSPDGRRILVANLQNDSVSVIDLATGATVEQDLRPGKIDRGLRGLPGGTFPRAVAWVSNTKAYVASERDREIIPLRLEGEGIGLGRRLITRGQPVALLAGPNGRLFRRPRQHRRGGGGGHRRRPADRDHPLGCPTRVGPGGTGRSGQQRPRAVAGGRHPAGHQRRGERRRGDPAGRRGHGQGFDEGSGVGTPMTGPPVPAWSG